MKTELDDLLQDLDRQIECFRMSDDPHVGCDILYTIRDILDELIKK